MTNSYPLFVDGKWLEGSGDPFESLNPADGSTVWRGNAASDRDVDQAFAAATHALPAWSRLSMHQRYAYLKHFTELLENQRDTIAWTISDEMGKPHWEALTELGAMLKKAEISRDAYEERCRQKTAPLGTAHSVVRFRPLGTVGVLGPFNLPGHLANGHIMPALLAGNTVVYKPSELTPFCGQRLAELWQDCHLPPGVFNLLQGDAHVGKAIAVHRQLAALYFTGGYKAGLELHRSFADRPEVLLALEMGGNNPLIVSHYEDSHAAAMTAIRSAYLTSGQRCTCARRLIVVENKKSDAFIETLADAIRKIQYASPRAAQEPFMGPLVTEAAADRAMEAHQALISQGATPIVSMNQDAQVRALVSPALLDVTVVADPPDEEIFAPLLQLKRVPDFHTALDAANATAYGLAFGLISDREEEFQEALVKSHAGIVNWNRPMTGASSSAPFGGIGKSGNHRPSAYFAADYCSYPVASIEAPNLDTHQPPPPGFNQ